MARPISEINSGFLSTTGKSVSKVAKAEDLVEENRQLLEETKRVQPVKNVIKMIKEMEAAEEAKQWRPPSKNRGQAAIDSAGGNRFVKDSAPPTYVNTAPALPERNPPKMKESKIKEKKNKKEEKKKVKSNNKKPVLETEEQCEYDVIPADQNVYLEPVAVTKQTQRPPSGEYDEPDEISKLSSRKTDEQRRKSLPKLPDKERVGDMNVEEVLKLLKLLGFDNKQIKLFKKNRVDGVLLKKMDTKVLNDEFKFSQFEALKLTEFLATGHIPVV